MAFKTVELDEDELKGGSGRKFKKFEKVGDKLLALFVKTEEGTANYSDGVKKVTKYIFWNRTEGEFEVTAPTDLDKKLKKAMKSESDGGFGLASGLGHLVKIAFASTLPIDGRTDPMKIFSVAVDTAPEAQFHTGAPAEVLFAKGGRPAKNTPPPEEDIPF